MSNTYDLVKHTLSKILNIDHSIIQQTDRLKEDLGLDSMSSLIFLIELEKNIPGFKISSANLVEGYLEDVSSICRYVETQLELAA